MYSIQFRICLKSVWLSTASTTVLIPCRRILHFWTWAENPRWAAPRHYNPPTWAYAESLSNQSAETQFHNNQADSWKKKENIQPLSHRAAAVGSVKTGCSLVTGGSSTFSLVPLEKHHSAVCRGHPCAPWQRWTTRGTQRSERANVKRRLQLMYFLYS